MTIWTLVSVIVSVLSAKVVFMFLVDRRDAVNFFLGMVSGAVLFWVCS